MKQDVASSFVKVEDTIEDTIEDAIEDIEE